MALRGPSRCILDIPLLKEVGARGTPKLQFYKIHSSFLPVVTGVSQVAPCSQVALPGAPRVVSRLLVCISVEWTEVEKDCRSFYTHLVFPLAFCALEWGDVLLLFPQCCIIRIRKGACSWSVVRGECIRSACLLGVCCI